MRCFKAEYTQKTIENKIIFQEEFIMMTFKETFLKGQCSIDAIDEWVKTWHEASESEQSLREFLGLTVPEYEIWCLYGNDGLAKCLKLKDWKICL